MILSFDIGLRNLGMCKLSVENAVDKKRAFSVHQWAVYSAVPDDINVNKTSIEVLCPMFSKLIEEHAAEWLDGATSIFIESQPMGRTRNLKTKILSHVLQVCLMRSTSVVPTFVHPTLKLKTMVGPRTYRANKKHAVTTTHDLVHSELCKTPECAELYVGKKRDDLADAFLQGYYAVDCQHATKAVHLLADKGDKKADKPADKPAKKRKASKTVNLDKEPEPAENAATEVPTTDKKPKESAKKKRKLTKDESINDHL